MGPSQLALATCAERQLLKLLTAAVLLLAFAAFEPGAEAAGASPYQIAQASEGSLAIARCPAGQLMTSIYKPLYGNAATKCNSTASYRIVTRTCLRQTKCSIRAIDSSFGGDPCPSVHKMLKFYYACRAVLAKHPPPPPPPRRPGPFIWSPMSATQKRRAEELLTIFENSDTTPQYGYAENLHDGRGITFGRSGFCTGTGDGVLVVRYYVKLKPSGNVLARYLPALERIDRNGGGGDVTGLDGFIQAVHTAAADELFRRAQDHYADQLYYQPSQDLAKKLGFRLALTKAELYDAYIQHGYSDPGYDVYSISANGMADWVNKQLGGSPLQGVDEKRWLQKYLERRRWVLSNTDQAWAESVPRVSVYGWIAQLGGYLLQKPMRLQYDTCRADRTRGPCLPQPAASRYSIGGVIYGDFLVD